MTVAARSRRIPRCDRCGLPGSLCLCAELPRVPTTTELVVLMHKTEIGKSSNTGRLALAVLERARRSIRGREGVAPEIPPAGRRLVLFPMPGARELTPSDAQAPLVLVVPDGSWSQARRMIDREPWASGAEVVRLPASSRTTRYDLRRQNRPEALCTFEAIAAALGVLEGWELERRLLAVLDAFLARARHVRTAGGEI